MTLPMLLVPTCDIILDNSSSIFNIAKTLKLLTELRHGFQDILT